MWLKQIADVTERSPVRVERSGLGLAQVGFDLGEGLFNWIQIGRISRQEQEPGTSLFQTLGSLFALVNGQVVEDHDVPLCAGSARAVSRCKPQTPTG
jgi:hypothetical protein